MKAKTCRSTTDKLEMTLKLTPFRPIDALPKRMHRTIVKSMSYDRKLFRYGIDVF